MLCLMLNLITDPSDMVHWELKEHLDFKVLDTNQTLQ